MLLGRDVNSKPRYSDHTNMRCGFEQAKEIRFRSELVHVQEGRQFPRVGTSQDNLLADDAGFRPQRHCDALVIQVAPKVILERFGRFVLQGARQAAHEIGSGDRHQ